MPYYVNGDRDNDKDEYVDEKEIKKYNKKNPITQFVATNTSHPIASMSITHWKQF